MNTEVSRENDTHRQWRLYEIAAEPDITPRKAFYRAVAEGLVDHSQEGYDEVDQIMA